EAGEIDYGEALRHADSQNELRLNIKLNSQRARKNLNDDEGVRSLSMRAAEPEDDEDEFGHGG
ncbi:MAG: hypothetical protein CMN26_16525, partial [Salinisphaera sp.]|nr:hypothetical protein [Salinisphaera sp.]